MQGFSVGQALIALDPLVKRRGESNWWTDLLGNKFFVLLLGVLVFIAVIGIILFLADKAPKKIRDWAQLAAFIAPASIFLVVGLVYPAIRTAILAFFDDSGTKFIGVDNFVWMVTQPDILRTLINTVIWVVVVPTVSVAFGLAYAIFIDKARAEAALKSLVFMPMAISFVGAGVIWRFMYEYRGADQQQIGLLNQILVWCGFQPQQFLLNSPLNTFFLIIVMIWIQTGFAMVVFSAAIKAIPNEIIEAAKLDGASAWQQFRNVTLPGIRGSMVVVLTTISIATLKVFDIVRTMTAGNYDTSVIANEMYTQTFNQSQPGRGAALALVLFLLVLPIVLYNVRVMRKQREIR